MIFFVASVNLFTSLLAILLSILLLKWSGKVAVVAPSSGAVRMWQGIDIGEPVSRFLPESILSTRDGYLIFIAQDCDICDKLVKMVRLFKALDRDLFVSVVYHGEDIEKKGINRQVDEIHCGKKLIKSRGVVAFPYALAVNNGTVINYGIVSRMEDVIALGEARGQM